MIEKRCQQILEPNQEYMYTKFLILKVILKDFIVKRIQQK